MTKAAAPTKIGKSIEAFRAAHDKNYIVPQKIRAALIKLGDGWEYELDFMRIAGVSSTDLATFREQFIDHIVTTSGKNPKRAWAGKKKLAEKLRAMSP
ncbi:MAG TPA: hypothetical protein VFB37_00955 [Steroidobacteraceae bacterium]|nr:hypothetical protein [Steroidobacteraceae bacterium]